ncbi:hypothetical protein MPSEU_000730100 [Mayamaea pseudoterrestris]|nr:hypothetical protein MPSEU_000730100 [Mayamaea pseudoterrestris]
MLFVKKKDCVKSASDKIRLAKQIVYNRSGKKLEIAFRDRFAGVESKTLEGSFRGVWRASGQGYNGLHRRCGYLLGSPNSTKLQKQCCKHWQYLSITVVGTTHPWRLLPVSKLSAFSS